jgi:hypothetical protein
MPLIFNNDRENRPADGRMIEVPENLEVKISAKEGE